MAFLLDDDGLLLSLTSMKMSKETEVKYPASFHIGFMQESEQLLDAEASSVFLYDEITDELYFEVVLAPPEVVQKIRGIRIKVSGGKGFAGECAHKRLAINCPDAQVDPRHNPAGDRLTGFVTR